MPWNGYYAWSIVDRNDNKTGVGGAFASRKQCIEYLNYKKEQHFFETGSMELAEEKWGIDNFNFEQCFVLNRETVLDKFPKIDLNKWDYDI